MASLAGSGMSLGTLWIEISARADEAVAILQDFGRQVDTIIEDQKKKWEGFANVGESFLKLGGALTAGITAPLAGLGMAAVNAAEGINTAKVAFTTMLGSGQAADKMLKELQSFAATTPFEFKDLVSAAQRMKALGFSAEQIIPTLRTIGDTVAASGTMSKEAIDGITLALGQMQLKGKVSAQEMQQLSERGVDAWGALAKAAGVTVPEAMKLAEKGVIDAATAVPAILEEMNRKAGGAMDAMSKTLTGQWSNFKDQVTQALIPIGQALIPILQKLLPILTDVMNKVAEAATWFSKLPSPIQENVIMIAAAAAALGPLLAGLGGMAAAIGNLMPSVTALAGVFGTSATGLGLWTAALALFATQAVQVTSELGNLYDAVATSSVAASDSKSWFDQLKEAFIGVDEEAKKAGGSIETVGKSAGGAAQPTNLLAEAMAGLQDRISRMNWTDFLSPLGMVRSHLAEVTTFISTLRGVFPDMEKTATDSLKKLQSANQSAMRAAADHATQLVELGKKSEEQKKQQQAYADALNKTGKATKQAADNVKPLSYQNGILLETFKQIDEQYRKNIESIVKWNLAHQTAESRIPKVTEVTKELDDQINALIRTMKEVPPAFLNAEQQAFDSMKAAVEPVKKLDEVYKELGITSSATLQQQVDDALAAYNALVEAGAPVEDLARALEVLKERLAGASAPPEGVAREWHSVWDDIADIGRNAVADIQQGLADSLFGFIDRGRANAELQKQADDLKASLSEQTQEWGDYQAEVSGEIEKLTAAHATELGKIDSDYESSLAKRLSEFHEYQADVLDNISAIREKHAEEAEKERQALSEKLEDQERDYAEYVSDVTRKIEEIREKYIEQLSDETEKLREQLRDRIQQYTDFVSDANTKMSRLGEDTQTNIDRETRDTQDSIDDRTRDYDRYAEDVARKIADVRNKNKGQYSKEEADLEVSLRRKKEDLDDYIAEQQQKLNDYVTDQRKRQQREEADNRASLDRKTRDHEEFLATNDAALNEAHEKFQSGLEREVSEQQLALDRRTESMDRFRDDTAAKMEAVTVKHAEEQAKEIAAQEAALAKKQTQLEEYNAAAALKYEEDRANAEAKYAEQLTDLNESLADKKAAYDKFVQEANGKLAEFDSQHRTIWGDIGGYMEDAFTRAGAALTSFVTEKLIGMLFKELGQLTDKILPGVTDALGGLFGGAKEAGSAISGVGGAAGQVGGGAGGAVGAAAGAGLSGVVSAVSGVVSAISSVIGNFQMAKMETTMNAVEHNTRYSMMYLGERSDGGILGQLFRVGANTDFLQGQLDTISAYLGPMADTFTRMEADLDNAAQWLNEILQVDRDTMNYQRTQLDGVIQAINAQSALYQQDRLAPATATVTFAGDPIAKAVGDQIMQQLRLQGMNLVPGR